MRDTIFLSHANPEDNEFTRWLALKLVNSGYRVWSDVTSLVGGEVFWDDIEGAIRYHANKFIYVLSKSSNQKDGSLKELHLAQSVARKEQLSDFVLPLLIDDLPFDEMTIELARINVITFTGSWARGLGQLLKKLNSDNTPTPNFNTGESLVREWWRHRYNPNSGVDCEVENLYSNVYKITDIPSTLYEYHIKRESIGLIGDASLVLRDKILRENIPPHPISMVGSSLRFIAFTDERTTHQCLKPGFSISESREILLSDLTSSKTPYKNGPKHIAELLRLSWDYLLEQELHKYELANRRNCYFFAEGICHNNKVHFKGVNGKKTWRAMIGYKSSSTGKKRYWHYGISGHVRTLENLSLRIRGHVLFSDNGVDIWSDQNKLHRARRSQCRSWWNAQWRDRMLATMSYLANDEQSIRLPLGGDKTLSLSAHPTIVQSPVSYALTEIGLPNQPALQDLAGSDFDAV